MHISSRLLLLMVVTSAFGVRCFSQGRSGNYFVHLKGSVKIMQVYKGGAAPAEDLLKKLSEPVPMMNSQLFLKKTYYGKTVYIIQTDSTGSFDLNIKPGIYNIYLSNEDFNAKKVIDLKDSVSVCEEQYKTQSHGSLKVYRKGNSPIEITVSDTINPCKPLPPAAPPKQN